MKYLSIWENPGEVLDFLSKWDFITPDEATEDYDLLKWFEGDPDYPEDMEGKLMKKDGTIETENVKFPNWRMVIPDPKKNEYVSVRLDFAGIRQFEADFKAKKKLDKRMEGYVRVGGCLFKLEYMIKAVRFMEHVGTDEFMVSPDGKRAALAVSGDSKMILMPVRPRTEFEDNEVCYGL